jgi:hypothetical protein
MYVMQLVPIVDNIREISELDVLLKNMHEEPISRTLAIRLDRNDWYKISLHKRTLQLAIVDILDLTLEIKEVDNAKKHLLPQMLA